MKIFSKHRKKVEAHRRFGSREFKEKLTAAKNHKRGFGLNASSGGSGFFSKTGFSHAGTYSAALGVAAIFYFLAVSPYFLITQIAVAGNSQVSSEQIESKVIELRNRRLMLVPQNSFFVLTEGRLNNFFSKQIPEIAEVKSKRSWPNRITIEVKERVPALVLDVGGRKYLIDDQGFVIKEIGSDDGRFPVVDQIGEEIKVGELIGGKLIPFIISVQKQWSSKINIGLVNAKIPGKGASEAEFVSSEGWSVFFSTERPVTNQLSNLAVLLNKQIRAADRSRLAYVDLRLSKWAYYCFKSTPCQQSDQEQLVQAEPEPKTSGTSQTTVETQE